MCRSPGATTRNHGHLHGTRHLVGDVQFVTIADTVRIDGVQADFANAQIFGLLGPFDGVDTHGLAATADIHLVSALKLVRNAHELRVHAEHHALAPKGLRTVGNNFRVQHGKAVHAHLLGTGQQGLVHVVEVADTATHRKRDKHAFCNLADHLHVARAVFGTRRNIVKHQFVDTVSTVLRSHLYGVADIDISLELDTLRDLAVADVEANNQTFSKHNNSQVILCISEESSFSRSHLDPSTSCCALRSG